MPNHISLHGLCEATGAAGVGPFREYVLGALLLDLDDPARIIGRLREPLLSAQNDEREGYVPNVVYSCGSMLFGGRLILPYGFSDFGARIATRESTTC